MSGGNRWRPVSFLDGGYVMKQEQHPLRANNEEPAAAGRPLRLPTSLRAFLLAVLVSALLTGLISVVRAVAPGPAWRWLLPVVFFVALESVITTHWLRHPDRRQLNRGAYRLAEYVVIALVLRLLTWMLAGGLPGLEAWRGYLLSPLSFIDGTYFVFLLSAFFAWERGITFSTLFDRLALSHAEVAYYSLPRRQQRERAHDRPINLERSTVFSSLIQQWVGGGFLLVLAAAMTTVNVAAIVSERTVQNVSRLGLPTEMLAALLVYFLLGLWLISQARLTMIRARWIADGVEAPAAITRTWNRAVLLLLLAVALVAGFLPIGSTFPIARLLELLMGLAVGLVQLLFFIFSSLIFLLMSLLGMAQEVESEPPPPPQMTPAPEVVPQAGPLSETAVLVLGGLFWIVVAVIALLALAFFLQDRGYRLEATTLRRWWKQLRTWLRTFWRGASRQATTLTRAVRVRLRRGEPGAGKEARTPWRFIRVNALPPREQVRYFYLSTVRRASEKGVERAPGETPSEYVQDLQENWPEAEGEIEALTGAFLRARYSRQSFSGEDVNPVKRLWKRVRAALRRRTDSR